MRRNRRLYGVGMAVLFIGCSLLSGLHTAAAGELRLSGDEVQKLRSTQAVIACKTDANWQFMEQGKDYGIVYYFPGDAAVLHKQKDAGWWTWEWYQPYPEAPYLCLTEKALSDAGKVAIKSLQDAAENAEQDGDFGLIRDNSNGTYQIVYRQSLVTGHDEDHEIYCLADGTELDDDTTILELPSKGLEPAIKELIADGVTVVYEPGRLDGRWISPEMLRYEELALVSELYRSDTDENLYISGDGYLLKVAEVARQLDSLQGGAVVTIDDDGNVEVSPLEENREPTAPGPDPVLPGTVHTETPGNSEGDDILHLFTYPTDETETQTETTTTAPKREKEEDPTEEDPTEKDPVRPVLTVIFTIAAAGLFIWAGFRLDR